MLRQLTNTAQRLTGGGVLVSFVAVSIYIIRAPRMSLYFSSLVVDIHDSCYASLMTRIYPHILVRASARRHVRNDVNEHVQYRSTARVLQSHGRAEQKAARAACCTKLEDAGVNSTLHRPRASSRHEQSSHDKRA